MTTDQLCQWLRENSSGIYRPARDAADLIDRLTREKAALVEALKSAAHVLEWTGAEYASARARDALRAAGVELP